MSIEATLGPLDRGDGATITVTIAGSGSIAGEEYRFDVWRTKSDAIDTDLALVSKTSADGIAILSAAGRTVVITLVPADTATLEDSSHYFKFKRTSGNPATLAKGAFDLD